MFSTGFKHLGALAENLSQAWLESDSDPEDFGLSQQLNNLFKELLLVTLFIQTHVRPLRGVENTKQATEELFLIVNECLSLKGRLDLRRFGNYMIRKKIHAEVWENAYLIKQF